MLLMLWLLRKSEPQPVTNDDDSLSLSLSLSFYFSLVNKRYKKIFELLVVAFQRSFRFKRPNHDCVWTDGQMEDPKSKQKNPSL